MSGFPLRLAGLLSAGLAAITLGAAFVAQYGFGLAPCQLCLWQRWPYAAAILLGLAAWRNQALRPWLLALTGLAFLATSGIGGFHTGVEYGWWKGLESCGGGSTAQSLEALRAQIMAAPIVRCDEVAFRFLGLSMAAWNAIWGLALAVLALGFARRAFQEAA
ncbi:disulfide bond formation protein B [Ferrovibrio sp.]|uniref:disulfide bond formation protein B n=1 Tax=Ferrovibrio sp. TaxID=1917215 RepID=UPI0025BE5AD0|nr:disulfide bond formation protein B [Ferrovibrio sp.]MBX3453225.1 disulfide bond formation protein B [Ferrovibrio sp.]